jgi:hypothetical protein
MVAAPVRSFLQRSALPVADFHASNLPECCDVCCAGEGIIAAAEKAAQQAADGSKGGRHSSWVPTLPAARCGLLSVLVHTEGVAAAGKLLLREHEQGLQASAAAAGRKGKAPSREVAAPAPSALLSLPVVNSFLLGAVSVAVSQQREGSDDDAESAAQSAVQVAGELCKQQLVAVSMGAAGAQLMAAAAATNSLILDATSWGCLAQLYGVLGQWKQVSNIVLAAVRVQLPGVDAGGLQVVLASAAAALNAAGQHVAAVQLLDGLVASGVTAVTHAGLAQQLMDAADNTSEAEQVRETDTEHAGQLMHCTENILAQTL